MLSDLVKGIIALLVIYGLLAIPIIRTRRKQREKFEKQKEAIELRKKQQEEVRIHMEEQRAAEAKRNAELLASEIEKRREASRIEREKKRVAYDAMISAIQNAPIVVAETKAKKIGAAFVNDLTYSTVTKKTDISKLGDFVAVDTETTGLRYTSDEVIDIAAIRFRDFKPVSKFSILLSPSKPIPAEATAINHITDEMVKGQPCFQQIAVSLIDFIEDDNIVGHNLPFDLKFIVRYGADISGRKRKYYDTLAIAKKTIRKMKMKWDKELEDYELDEDSDGVPNYKLETLCSYLEIPNADAHRAENDALAAGLLFKKLIEMRRV